MGSGDSVRVTAGQCWHCSFASQTNVKKHAKSSYIALILLRQSSQMKRLQFFFSFWLSLFCQNPHFWKSGFVWTWEILKIRQNKWCIYFAINRPLVCSFSIYIYYLLIIVISIFNPRLWSAHFCDDRCCDSNGFENLISDWPQKIKVWNDPKL
jgi:hypothetical protein